MGCKNSKDSNSFLNRFTDEEQLQLRRIFCAITNIDETKLRTRCLSSDELKLFVGDTLSSTFTENIFQGMLDVSSTKGVTFLDFAKVASYIFVGTDEERSKALSDFLCRGNRTTSAEFHKVLNDVSSTLIDIVLPNWPNYQSWRFTSSSKGATGRLATLLFENLLGNDETTLTKWNSSAAIDKIEIETRLNKATLLSQTSRVVINHFLPIIEIASFSILPKCFGVNWNNFETSLDLPSLLLLNNSIPSNLRESWNFLYSSKTHGASFSYLRDLAVSKGPTIVIVKDKDGFVFGGFSSVSWDVKPEFTGTESCFVFQLFPEMRVYESSGRNQNFAYLNAYQHPVLPKGLGFGGEINYFGLWIDAELDRGYSVPSCATYNNCQMISGQQQFKIEAVEIWAVGPQLRKHQKHANKSILDCNEDAKMILTMLNGSAASDGLRDRD